MPTHAIALEATPSLAGRRGVVGLSIVVLAVAFYFIEHRNAQVSSLQAFTVTGDDMADMSAEGDLGRRLAFPLLGLFGLALLLRHDGARLGLDSRLGWLLLVYFLWCVMSILWSVDPPLTIRRVGVLVFCGLAALGLARQTTLRDLCIISLTVAAIHVANGLRVEIALGTFQPFSSEYRFAGTQHPNAQALYCATMALAAAYLARRAERSGFFLWTLCLIGMVLMVMTKSRTVCAAFLGALLAYGVLDMPWSKRILLGTSVVSILCFFALAGALLARDLNDRVINLVLIGRQEEVDSLSGRVPLWTDLGPHVQERLLLGHGYLTFWSPQRIESFSRTFQWTVPDGHNAYIDAALNLGLIGAALCAAIVMAGIYEAARRHNTDSGCGFLFALLTCRAFNAFLESGFDIPMSFTPFIMACGLMHLGFCRAPSEPFYSTETMKEAAS